MTAEAPPSTVDVPARPIGGARALLAGIWGDRNGRIGAVLMGLLVLAALLSVLHLTGYDPIGQGADQLAGPSGAHWMGTDQLGRDVLSRVAAGIVASLRIAVVSVGLATVIGGLLGVLSGFAGGILDGAVGRLTDILFAFPATLLALALVAALGHGWFNTAIAIAVVYTPIFVRVARGPVLAVRESEYVRAGRVLGFSRTRLLFRHVLPNVAAPIAVQVALALSWAILTEAGLSFLGLGTQPPDPSLGLMVSESRTLFTDAWWTLVFPAGVIVVAVVGLNLIGDGLRNALDPEDGPPMSMLQVDDLRTVVASGRRHAAADADLAVVRGVSLTVRAGEIVGLVGESGSGKSFTALSIMGLLPDGARVVGGRIRVDGEDLLALPERARRTRRGGTVAMIYQDPMTALNPLMTVGAQISEGLRAHGVPGAEAKRRTLEAIEEVGLPRPERVARSYPHRLSGGQRQRIVIASALALRPKVLIADEPTTALDVTIQQQILALVDELRTAHDLAVLWITHDLGVVARVASRVAVMYAGRVAEFAPTRELFAAPRHPYTAGLLASIPSPTDLERGPLAQIGGAPPDLTALPAGCPFASRCPHRIERCGIEEPELTARGDTLAACHVPPERWT